MAGRRVMEAGISRIRSALAERGITKTNISLYNKGVILMTGKAIDERLTSVFRDAFDNDGIVITDTTTSADVDGWDSFGHIYLIGAIEEEFGMKFSMGEVTGMHSVGEMVDIVAERATK
jgi:acyl carrier protein